MVKIIWLGHSCFKLECEGHSIVIDPYNAMMANYAPLSTSAGLALKSHDHGDHNFLDAVKIVDEPGENPFTVSTMATFHDNAQGAQRGPNTVHIIDVQGLRLVHFGDLGHMLSDEQFETLGKVDVLMTPVVGGPTIGPEDAWTICKRLDPTVILPMHYRIGPPPAPGQRVMFGPVDDFLKVVDGIEVKRYDTNYLEIDENTLKQIAILTYIPGED